MEQQPKSKNGYFFPVKTTAVIAVLLSLIAIGASAFKDKRIFKDDDTKDNSTNKDSVESALAFLQVYKVLMSPRCMNCHPAGDIPLQGNDSHLHTMSPKRGKDGHGVYAMKCSNCHQSENVAGVHAPPGNPKWALPPAEMKMIFEGRSAHDLALQIMDYKRNGHKNKEQLIEHARDTLVRAGWNMGEGRPAPPLSHKDFLKVWDIWIKKGGYAPTP